jgi:hypothetical protein
MKTKLGNMNAEMMHVRAVLRAPWTEAELAVMAAQKAAEVPGRLPEPVVAPEPLVSSGVQSSR